jgi:hypothetical protein
MQILEELKNIGASLLKKTPILGKGGTLKKSFTWTQMNDF